MKFSTKLVIGWMPCFLLITTTIATWAVSGWDGLACGDRPQAANRLVWKEENEVVEECASLDPGPKAYSMIAETDTDDIEVWAYSLPGCRGARKRVESVCANPDISFRYFASYKVTRIPE